MATIIFKGTDIYPTSFFKKKNKLLIIYVYILIVKLYKTIQ